MLLISFIHRLKMKSVVILVLFSIFISKYNSQDIPDHSRVTQGEKLLNDPPQSQPSPYALSPTYLTYLADKEVKIYEHIAKYAEDLEERLELIRAYMNDYESSSMKMIAEVTGETEPLEKAANIVSHPIAAYRMVRRFAKEFDTIGKHLSLGLEETLKHSIRQLSVTNNMPSEVDLRDAMDAILRLNYVYDMDLKEFSRGRIMKLQTNVEFTTSQSFEIAKYAIEQNQYSLALSWLQATEARLKETDQEESAKNTKADVERTYKEIITNHDLDFDKNKSKLYMFTEKLSDNPNASTFRKNGSMEDDHYRFLALCNGVDFQSPKYKSTLKCWYQQRNPYFYLFPLKAELLHHNPLIIQFHEIVSPAWIKEMKEKAMPTLKRPPPIIPGATQRTTVVSWLEDEEIPNVALSRRIELITNLHARGKTASTDLQIAGYAYGAHVALHVDSYRSSKDNPSIVENGNILTTFLIYLNDVEKGGITAFPVFGTHVKPEMGSAVLWYNAMRNGDVDEIMVHGACPVVMGHKWIATKWTYLNDNFLKRPCHLNAHV